MRLYEFESKRLLGAAGIPVPPGKVISEVDQLDTDKLVVVKAQLLIGGRQKKGGVVFCSNLAEAKEKARRLLGSRICGCDVNKVLVEEQVKFKKEYFMAVSYDDVEKKPLIIFMFEGGVEVERMARIHPEKVIKESFEISRGFMEYQARQIIAANGMKGKELLRVSRILRQMVQIFLQYDATLVEINPLVVTEEENVFALDAHINLDDDALYRHPELETRFGISKRQGGVRIPSDFEKKAAEIDDLDYRGVAGRVIEFDGDLALIIGGGGASLTSFDAVRKYGGSPANYCEIGGNPSVKKVKELTKLILSKPGVKKIAVIMNVVSNTRVDLVARGVVKAILELGRDPSETIAILRIPGAWEEEGFKILQKYGIEYCDRTVSIDEAARRATERVKMES